MKLRHAAMLLGLSLLAACSSASKHTDLKPASLVEIKESASFTVRWHRNIGDIGDIDYCSSGLEHPGDVRWRKACYVDKSRNVLQPSVTSDAVYAANAHGELFRLARATGDQVWRISSGFTISGGVGAGEGLVLVGGEKGEIAAFSEDGKLRWQSKVTSEVLGVPQVSSGIVIVRSADGRIAALSAADGKRLWLYERQTPSLILRSHASVVIRHGVIFVGFSAGKLVAINLANGSVKWETAVSQPRGNTDLERISDISSLPEVDDEEVCAVSFQGRIGCFDIAQGSLLWSRELSSDKGLTLLRKYLYVTDAQGAVLALDKISGSSLWKNEQLYMRRTTTPYALDNYLVVGDFQGYLHAIKREDGSLAARLKTDGSAIFDAPVQLDDGILVQTQDSGLYYISIH